MHLGRIHAWVEHCDHLHQDLLPLHKVLLASVFDDDRHTVLRQLSTACLRSTGSVLVLLENDRHWDAELVLRSVQEGTIRFAYLLSDEDQFSLRVREFSEDLFDIASLKTHDRAMKVINIFANSQINVVPAVSGVLLDQTEYDLMSSRYPRKVRQQVEGRWGFTRLIEDLAGSSSSVAELFPMLLHGYGMASHLQHADAVGVAMVAERESRPEPRRSAAKLAHIARIISDCNSYSFLRLIAAHSCAREDANQVREVWKKHEEGFKDLQKAQDEWERIEFS